MTPATRDLVTVAWLAAAPLVICWLLLELARIVRAAEVRPRKEAP